MKTHQLTLFQQDVEIIEKNGVTMYRCSKDAARWLTPNTPCYMCFPSQEIATCKQCGSEFTEDRRMIEHMRIGGDVLCGDCLPRMSTDDFRDPNRLHREAEETRLEYQAQRNAARELRFVSHEPN